MKYVVIILVLGSIAAIVYGFRLEGEPMADKFIGGGTAVLFLVAMPLFLYKEGKGKKINDYMLTEDNIRKMRGKDSKKTQKD